MVGIGNRYIVDSSVVLAWLLPLEIFKNSTENLFDLHTKGRINLFAPSIIEYEVVNGLKMAVLRKRITREKAFEIYSSYIKLHIGIVVIRMEHVLDTAILKGLSAYDSAYAVALISLSIPLITGDKKLYNTLRKEKKVIWIEEFK